MRNMAKQETRIVCNLLARLVGRDGEYFVTRIVGLPIVTQGETEAEAIQNLVEAAQLFIESCHERGTLDAVLLEHGWTPATFVETEEGCFSLPVPVDPVIASRSLCHA